MAETSPSDGQSQWRLIWRQFARRKLAVLSAVVIFVLIFASIWAPFLANDRPLYYYGVNRFEYSESLRNCSGAVGQMIALRRKSPAEAPPESVRQGLSRHLPLMKSLVSAEDARRLTEWEAALNGALAERDDKSAISRLEAARKSLRAEFSESKVTLLSRRRWPVLASLNRLDAFFMVLSLTTISYPAWRKLMRRLSAAAVRRVVGWSIWLGIPLVAALTWRYVIPLREDTTNYKDGRLAAEASRSEGKIPVVYEAVVWPPIPYGLAESVLENKYHPPAWRRSAMEKGNPPAASSVRATSPWSAPHWLGTDSLGRDALSRMLWGGRVSLSVGVVSVSIYVTIGIILGALAGYFRGIVDLVISRIIEIVICFPTFFLILTIVAFLGPSIFNIMIVIGLTGWTGVARLIRAEFLRLVDQEFVLAGRALGYSPARLIFRHILPNAIAPVLVSATFGVAGAILTESALSFLGLGITIPIPSWGGILSDGRRAEGAAPWLILIPGLAIFVTITCYNLVGEALRDASDPRLRGSRA
jgi:peptide/nickel transport system permease protein